MNELVIKSAADVDEFVNSTIWKELAFYEKKKKGDVGISVDLLVASRFLEHLLYQKIADHDIFGDMVVLSLPALYSKCTYPKNTRIYLGAVNGKMWPSDAGPPRNDCAALLVDIPQIQNGYDIQVFKWMLMHVWAQKMQVPEPFFWYQDVLFADRNVLDDFFVNIWQTEPVHCMIRVSSRIQCNEHISFRLYIQPWRFTCNPAAHHGPKASN